MTATATAAGDTVTKKKRALGLLLLAGLLWLGGTMPVQAQCVAKNEAFQSGEHVMYDLYFNWKFIWKKVALPIIPSLHIVSTFSLWAARKLIFSLRCAIR